MRALVCALCLHGVASFAAFTRRAAVVTALGAALPHRTQPAWAVRPYLESRFSISLPDGFAITKKNGVSGTLFVAGNFPRAIVISVSVWALADLLAEDASNKALPGLDPPEPPVLPATATGSLTSLEAALGGRESFTRLLLRKRDREASAGALQSVLLSNSDLANGKLTWSCTTEVPVADPEELYKQRGVRSINRKTVAASFLGLTPAMAASGGGGSADLKQPAIFSACASALETDWPEVGPELQAAVESFALGAAAALPVAASEDAATTTL